MGDIQKKALERAREILTIAGKEKTLDRIEEFVAKYGEAPPVDNSVLTPVKEVV